MSRFEIKENPKAIYPLLGYHSLKGDLVWYHSPLHHCSFIGTFPSRTSRPWLLLLHYLLLLHLPQPAELVHPTTCLLNKRQQQPKKRTCRQMMANVRFISFYIFIRILNFALAHTKQKKNARWRTCKSHPISIPATLQYCKASPSTSRSKVNMSIMKLLAPIYLKRISLLEFIYILPSQKKKNFITINLTITSNTSDEAFLRTTLLPLLLGDSAPGT